MTCQNCFSISGFFPAIYAALPRSKIGGFSLILKGFNIGQERLGTDRYRKTGCYQVLPGEGIDIGRRDLLPWERIYIGRQGFVTRGKDIYI